VIAVPRASVRSRHPAGHPDLVRPGWVIAVPRASVRSRHPAGHPDLVRPGWVIAVPRASVRSRYAAGTPTQGSGHVSTAPGDDRREVRAHGRPVVEGSFAKAHDGPSSGEQGTISALVRGQLCIGGVEQQPVGLEGETQFWGGDVEAGNRPACRIRDRHLALHLACVHRPDVCVQQVFEL